MSRRHLISSSDVFVIKGFTVWQKKYLPNNILRGAFYSKNVGEYNLNFKKYFWGRDPPIKNPNTNFWSFTIVYAYLSINKLIFKK